MPTVIRSFPWGQDQVERGAVKVVAGSLHLRSKPILRLSDVVGLPECPGSFSVRLRLLEGAWVEVVFDNSAEAERFKQNCEVVVRRAMERGLAQSCPERTRRRPDGAPAATEDASSVKLRKTDVAGTDVCSPPKALAGSTVASPTRHDEQASTALSPRKLVTPTHTLDGLARKQLRLLSPPKTACASAGATSPTLARPSPLQGIAPMRTEEWVCRRWEDHKVLTKTCISEVRLSRDRQSGELQAMKIINKRAVQLLERRRGSSHVSMRSEATLLGSLKHGNVVQLLECFETDACLYLVMEFLPGGSLFHMIAEHGRLRELQAKRLFRELCEAVAYLHSQGVVHRDIKPENILLTQADADKAHLKVGDLGISRQAVRSRDCLTYCGSLVYLAPEVVTLRAGRNFVAGAAAKAYGTESKGDGVGRRGYGKPADVWGLGAVLYVMLSGIPPFDMEDGEENLCRQIVAGSWVFDDDAWAMVSREAKELVLSLMAIDPCARPTAQEILGHRWFATPGFQS
mmetsp:Transcript_115279/g.325764  ORF Transcript_115279/g.325764 Transcript_115279/m.325764 type:complete len:515 (-) Transcript_115279:149-1693(-)